jgi:hypothetical protein
VYGLPDGFCLPSFTGATLTGVQATRHQMQLRFDGNNRGISIEGRFAVHLPGGDPTEFTDHEAGGTVLAALTGTRLQCATGTTDGTLTLVFGTGAKILVFDDSTQYESYQICDGDRLIVV